ncbi:matrix-remodeling-associated protein 7 isoform X1 [Ammospiza caudacuta]|uniref:matrix-remodeling-associated protein 7 isoform X1 n=1 Tax=Ammospiza caudacuta TaxID=2857398 RepID=UPI0027397D21|nr:matrix-remodeling-associated protein 7 isoform X1 [Ammospiza caudacuta]
MELPVDSYLAVPLLFTVLALVLASVFLRLRGGGGERAAERPRGPAAEPAREGGPGGEAAAAGPEDEGSRVPVEEVGVGGEGKEAVTEQREAAEEPGPAAEPSPAATESIPRQPPEEPRQTPEEPRQTPEEPRQPPEEPRQPGHREDAESKIPPLGASPGSGLGHTGQAEDTRGHEALSSHAEEEEVDSENEKLVVREPEDEDAAEETFSFKYSPGKLRGNQYKSMMSKEELEEEQRVQREQLAAIFRLMKEKSDTFGEMSEGDMKEQLRLYDI